MQPKSLLQPQRSTSVWGHFGMVPLTYFRSALTISAAEEDPMEAVHGADVEVEAVTVAILAQGTTSGDALCAASFLPPKRSIPTSSTFLDARIFGAHHPSQAQIMTSPVSYVPTFLRQNAKGKSLASTAKSTYPDTFHRARLQSSAQYAGRT